MVRENFYTDLRARRIHKGLSIYKLAVLVGVTPESIRNIERCKTLPNVLLAMRLAEVFEVKVETLFRRQEA